MVPRLARFAALLEDSHDEKHRLYESASFIPMLQKHLSQFKKPPIEGMKGLQELCDHAGFMGGTTFKDRGLGGYAEMF
eukprot:SAG31_NODE_39568_length_287_cov_0.824468_1_plen_77_part_01